jgi:hypothetical protein
MFRYWPLTRIGTLNYTIDEGDDELTNEQ